MVSDGKNRATAMRWMEEVWNQRREEVVDELMHVDAVGHMEGGDVHGPAGFKAARAAFLEALPDLEITVEGCVEEGDQVVLRWRVNGTHRGSGLGIPPSGQRVEARGMSWFVLRDGRMAEGWDSWDQTGLIQRLTPA